MPGGSSYFELHLGPDLRLGDQLLKEKDSFSILPSAALAED